MVSTALSSSIFLDPCFAGVRRPFCKHVYIMIVLARAAWLLLMVLMMLLLLLILLLLPARPGG
jgi:hypothetical protein